jgi:hypothetical protein
MGWDEEKISVNPFSHEGKKNSAKHQNEKRYLRK